MRIFLNLKSDQLKKNVNVYRAVSCLLFSYSQILELRAAKTLNRSRYGYFSQNKNRGEKVSNDKSIQPKLILLELDNSFLGQLFYNTSLMWKVHCFSSPILFFRKYLAFEISKYSQFFFSLCLVNVIHI